MISLDTLGNEKLGCIGKQVARTYMGKYMNRLGTVSLDTLGNEMLLVGRQSPDAGPSTVAGPSLLIAANSPLIAAT